MGMDPRFRGHSGFQLKNQTMSVFPNQPVSVFPNQNFVTVPRFQNTYIDHNFKEFHYHPPDPTPSNTPPVSSLSHEEDPSDDCDFSDSVLRYISHILMEEDMEDKSCMLQESLDLQAAEKSFYDVLGKKYPPSPDQNPSFVYESGENPNSYDDSLVGNYNSFVDNCWMQKLGDYGNGTSQALTLPVPSISKSSYCSSIASIDGMMESPNSTLQVPDLNGEIQSIWQFRKGVEEASKFIPRSEDLFGNLEVYGVESQGWTNGVVVKEEKKDDGEYRNRPSGSKGRKISHRDDVDSEEERSSKQAAVFEETDMRSEMFDMVLLCSTGKEPTKFTAFRESLRNGTGKIVQQRQNGAPKGPKGGKNRGKKQNGKKEVVDLRTLLIHCAQAVAADDQRTANELLKKIRQHSSPFGDGNQRLAHCFADGLEARLAGTGSHIYKSLVSKRTSASDILKAYYLYVAASPFRKVSHFICNKTINLASRKSMKLHIIDFGILYGFQWPTIMERFSLRSDGPPLLRITGIDFPQPGFRPAERVEETGRRLAAYAEEFKVPFQYNAIAKKWENITLEELDIHDDEFVVVNCLYRSKNLLDESVAVDSPRNMVLNLIKKINPKLFVFGIMNGAYNAPFFVTRFREVLFHFSSMFDMLETIVPREEWERMTIEKEIFGREALNVIACEGWERVERPETFKQWHARNLRAGFLQVPFEREIVKEATYRVQSFYHKDFLIDEDSRWLVQGWKGRILYALSAWKPA
ncbi:Transcription factor GRAS [Corchorus olitorius]|uniref:Transcription factor GRAS n=1 Tax=Corchorus olitorius TaxID=93759 RepID=A0A1R3JQR9_9ROSI|nr:Transcription factor GRAS [Corchorus olitorius]